MADTKFITKYDAGERHSYENKITERYSDGHDGRCAIGVIMSYYGWNGKDDSYAGGKLLGALIILRYAGIDKDSIIRLNDSGVTFDEIADYLDRVKTFEGPVHS